MFDGHEWVRSIDRYFNNEFALGGLSVLREYRAKNFFQLPEREQRFCRMRTHRIILVSIYSQPNMKFEIYERLNTGSIMLNAQELRNSIYRGPFNDLLHELVTDTTFRSLIGTKTPRRRMVDEELLLRSCPNFLSLDVDKTADTGDVLKRIMAGTTDNENPADLDEMEVQQSAESGSR
nr:hypothetical protein [Mesorhizobium amorphae]